MQRFFPRAVPALALALVAASGAPAPLRATAPVLRQAEGVQRAQTELLNQRGALGLDGHTAFTPRHASLNPQGRTVVRFQQTHDGHRVWGAAAIAHVEADGRIKTLTSGVKGGIVLPAKEPVLTAAQARATALRHLAAKGPLGAEPKVELVVFPTRFTGGLATRLDPVKGVLVIDRELSTWAKAPADPYVLAYEVKTLLANKVDGHKELSFIIDATTGAVLRKANELQGDTPAQGTGTSFYKGTVPLATTQATDGTFALRSTERGSLPQPYVAEQGGTQVGLTTYYGYADMVTGNLGFLPYEGKATNAWGDGTVIPPAWDFNFGGVLWDFNADGTAGWMQGALSPAGETTAVDAHYGLSASWDFYKNVFNRNGIDDQGTSTFAIVHYLEYGWAGASPLFDNAMWSPWFFGMVFGDGTYPSRTDWWSMKAMTELDITGHELTHGVTRATADLTYEGESGGLNEASSDMLGKMVQAYTEAGGTGTTVPDFPAGDLTKWQIGKESRPDQPLRYFYKPSLDGASADEWYGGIEFIDVHYNSGPPNRFFYFLSQGASTDPASATFSPYLPGGMAGLGNDKAGRIWYKTLTEYLVPDSDFEAARAASVTAAEELFGAASPEVTAVMKAWAAVNVGAAPGQPDPVRVSFPTVHPAGSFLDLNAYPTGILAKVQIFPTNAKVVVKAEVRNTANTAVTWSDPAWSTNGVSDVGKINPDGTWTTPAFAFYEELINLTARSQADPRQYAKGHVLLVPADTDTDNETDALDMAEVAMSWGLPQTPHPAAQVAGWGVSDWDIVFLGESLANAFPVE